MNLQSFIVLLVLFVLLALAVVWISKNGGWTSGGCHGNCQGCNRSCAEKDKNPKKGPEK